VVAAARRRGRSAVHLGAVGGCYHPSPYGYYPPPYYGGYGIPVYHYDLGWKFDEIGVAPGVW